MTKPSLIVFIKILTNLYIYGIMDIIASRRYTRRLAQILTERNETMKELINLFVSFYKIGALTFGGGLAMLPMLEREIVTKRGWADMDEITDYFAIGQCTPGIIAVNTATFIGYKRKKIIGGIVATLGVITPSLIIICALAGVIDAIDENVWVQHAFAGISVAVCALLVQSIIKLAKSGVKDAFQLVLAVSALAASLIFGTSSIPVIIAAGLIGCVYRAVLEKNKALPEKSDGKKGEGK